MTTSKIEQRSSLTLSEKGNVRRRPNRSDLLELIASNRHLKEGDFSRCEGEGECIGDGDGGGVA